MTTCAGQASLLRTEPAQIVLSGDGSFYLDYLAWTGWGTPTARGTGVLEADNCTPNCAAGTMTGYRATVTLSGLTAYSGGVQAYALMVVNSPGYRQAYPQSQPLSYNLLP